MLDHFQTWAIYKGADYRTGKSTASAPQSLLQLADCID
jgi:hypothetical protein